MKNSLQKFKTEDWVVTLMGAILLALSALISKQLMPAIPTQWDMWGKGVYLFATCLVILYIGQKLLGKQLRGLFVSFIFVFLLTVAAQVLASIPFIKAYGFESVFFSVILGIVISNFFTLPSWLKPAILNEYYIKIGVVCLGAEILFSNIMKSGFFGLVQSMLVVLVVWFSAFKIFRLFKVDERSAMVASSGLSICGVSASVSAQKSANADPKKLSYIVSIILIIVVPMIYLMPWLAQNVVPMFFSDPTVIAEVQGAWLGGTIDTTSGVAASSEMISSEANATAMIVKSTQNILIGFVVFFIALYLSTHGSEEQKGEKVGLGVVWEKFPKFILGFVLASLVFSVVDMNSDWLAQTGGKSTANMFRVFFFSMAFVCIGLETRLKDIVSKENRNLLWGFITAQSVNIVVTLILAIIMFGYLKPMFG
ncbi:MAG: putative sulfate exporter family transporter [Rikenellaceae bacterium]